MVGNAIMRTNDMMKWCKIGLAAAVVGLMMSTAAAADDTAFAASENALNVADAPLEWGLSGGNHKIVEHECGDIFEYPALTAWDACEGDLTDYIIVGGDLVLPDLVGDYVVTYNVFDSAGNAAREATRTIQVIDTVPPIITVFGGNPATIPLGEAYTDGPVTAFDACDGDLSERILTDNPVDVHIPGEYTITYNVSDAAGNAAVEAARTVYVSGNAILLDSLQDIILSEGMFYEWDSRIENESEVNVFQWYRHDGRHFVPIVDGPFGNGAFLGAETGALRFAPFTVAMAGRYMLEVVDDKAAVQKTASVTVHKDSELPAAGAVSLVVAALATAITGAAAFRKRRR